MPHQFLIKNKKKAKKPKKRFNLINLILMGLFFCLVIGFSYFLFLWPGLSIEKIEIDLEEEADLKKDQIVANLDEIFSQKYFYLIPKRNIIVASLSEIEQSLLSQFPLLAKVEITKKINLFNQQENSLNLSLEKKQAVMIWCQAELIIQEALRPPAEEIVLDESLEIIETISEKKINQCFYLDNQGLIFKKAPLTQGSLIYSIYDFRHLDKQEGDLVLDPDLNQSIFLIIQELAQFNKANPSNLQINIANFEISSVQDLSLVTADNWLIYFNAKEDIQSQLRALKRALVEEIKSTDQILEYVDLRIKNRVYYK